MSSANVIPLLARDGSIKAHALVDPEDVETLSTWTWRLHSRGYACAEAATLLMHRVLMGLDAGDPRQVDHENRNKLDCRRSNLRVVAGQAEQMQNVPGRPGTSRYRGVSFYPPTGRWVARVKHHRKIHNLGYHATEEQAAQVAAAFRRDHMPYATEEATS